MKEDMVEIKDFMIKMETEKAYLLVIGSDEIWIPKSQCEFNDEQALFVAKWLCEKNEIPYG